MKELTAIGVPMHLPVESFLDNLRTQEGFSARTMKAYANDTNQFYKFLLLAQASPPRIADFNKTLIKKFLESELYGGKQRNTVLRRLASLRQFSKYLKDNGLIDNDPTADQWLPERRKRRRIWKSRKPKIIVDKEIERVLKLMAEKNSARALRDQAIFRVMLESGMLVNTLVGIDVSEIDIPNLRVWVIPEGFNHGYWLNIPRSTQYVSKYMLEGRPNLTDVRFEEALFVSQMGGRITRQAVWWALRNWGKLAKLKLNLTPRLVRQTAAAAMLARKLRLKEIQKLLGHRNLFSTRALLKRISAAPLSK